MRFLKPSLHWIPLFGIIIFSMTQTAYETSVATPLDYQQVIANTTSENGTQLQSAGVADEYESSLQTFGSKNDCYQLHAGDEITFGIDNTKEGLYHLALAFYPITDSFAPIDIGVQVNGTYSLQQSNSIWLQTDWQDQGSPLFDRWGMRLSGNSKSSNVGMKPNWQTAKASNIPLTCFI